MSQKLEQIYQQSTHIFGAALGALANCLLSLVIKVHVLTFVGRGRLRGEGNTNRSPMDLERAWKVQYYK